MNYQSWKPNRHRCYYCRSLVRFYKKQYKSKDTTGLWLTCANLFESCSRPKCPDHFEIEVDKVLPSHNEQIKYISTFLIDTI